MTNQVQENFYLYYIIDIYDMFNICNVLKIIKNFISELSYEFKILIFFEFK